MDKQDKQTERNMREIILYIVCGVVVTLVNFVAFEGLEWLLKPQVGSRSYLMTDIVAFIIAIIVAFPLNKIYVFRSKSWELRKVTREASTFVTARLLGFGTSYLLTYVFFDLVWLLVSDWFTQLWEGIGLPLAAESAYRLGIKWGVIAVFVLVFNYIASKFVIFKKPAAQEDIEVEEVEEEAEEASL